jgi:hypothetical protein|tara:strand:- start:149 stop:418 length:270 start_codon:yes stop_codon:yes gene_type:complete
MNKINFDSNGIYATSPELNRIALQVLEQERIERATCRSAAQYETVTFGDMVRGVTDEGDFDDHFTAEDYDRRRAQRDGWGTVYGDRWAR